MKRLGTWLCMLALLAPWGCASDMDDNDSEASSAAPAAPHTFTAADDGDEAELGAAESEGPSAATPSASRAASATPGAAAAPSSGAPPSAPTGTAPAAMPSASSPPPASDAAGPGTPASTPAPSSGESSASAPAKAPTPPPADGPGNVQAGTLTAGVWDDNLNFDRFKQYRAGLVKQQLAGVLPSTDDEHAKAHDEFSQRSARETLDVLLMIDTTGSMGDEIRYLQAEFVEISSAIEAKYPNAQQRWSLIVYRDQGDQYVTRVYDFRDSASEFRDQLGLQAAGGGGDFPEAPDAAFDAMKQLTWRSGDGTARLVFWVADAPHHNERAAAMLEGIRGAKQLGVHVYPVASSGVDELTELSMRTAAQLTGGRYLFLTDDSGVGGAHKEPSIPCYFVTRLDHAILRMVDAELTAEHSSPNMETIIRSSGKPMDGKCSLTSGETVTVY